MIVALWVRTDCSWLSGSWTPSRPCPPSPLLPHTTLNSDTTPPPNVHTPTSPPLTNCDPHQSLCAALEWSLPHPALSVIYLFWQSDKRLFFFLHYSHPHSFVLFYLTGLHYICHVPYVTLSLFFIFYCSTMSSFVYLYSLYVCMYIWLNCIYLYLNVYCQCLMLTVCTKGLRVTQFQFSVCMYCTCGRIDNKTYLTWLWSYLVYIHATSDWTKTISPYEYINTIATLITRLNQPQNNPSRCKQQHCFLKK